MDKDKDMDKDMDMERERGISPEGENSPHTKKDSPFFGSCPFIMCLM